MTPYSRARSWMIGTLGQRERNSPMMTLRASMTAGDLVLTSSPSHAGCVQAVSSLDQPRRITSTVQRRQAP
jgi:hypothetical protein